MSSQGTPSPTASKRLRKANYSDHEIWVLLEEVMLARTVLFSAFSNRITLQEKNKAWDRVASSVTACGVAHRSRVEIKERWKTMKADVLGRQRRSGQTGGGPPDKPLPFEESVLQILGADSNLYHGVSTSYALSYLGPVDTGCSVSATAEVEATAEATAEAFPAVDLRFSGHAPMYTYPEESTSFAAGAITRPLLTSTPLGPAPVPFTMSGDQSLTVVTGFPGDAVVLTGEPEAQPEEPEEAVRPPSAGSSTQSHAVRGRSRSRPQKDFPAVGAERQAFLDYLEGTNKKNAAKTSVLNACIENDAAERERAEAKSVLEHDILLLKYRRELLRVQLLEREREAERDRVDRELVHMRLRGETLEVARLEREMGERA